MKIKAVKAIGAMATLVVISVKHAASADQYSDPDGQKFRHEMLPKVDHRVTFVGTVVPGKFGVRITRDHWNGIEVEARGANRADLAKLNELDRLQGRTVKVEGVLHFQPYTYGKPTIPMAATVTEHFYFDVKDISYSEIRNERSKIDTKPNQHPQATPR